MYFYIYVYNVKLLFMFFTGYFDNPGQAWYRDGEHDWGGGGSEVRLGGRVPEQRAHSLAEGQTKDMVTIRRTSFILFCKGNAQALWQQTQSSSVDFSQSRIGVKKCVFNKHTIKVCVSCFWRCPGTSAPSATHLTLSLYLRCSGSNARGKSRVHDGD